VANGRRPTLQSRTQHYFQCLDDGRTWIGGKKVATPRRNFTCIAS
jgi:hypothetical protein